MRIVSILRGFTVGTILFLSAGASAVLIQLNDANFASSTDGFNITRDTATGLEWLDVAVSAGRTFDDLIGIDGTNEFAAGGDFAGFRYATRLEIHGNTAQGQIDSLFKSANLGVMAFSYVGGYAAVKGLLDFVGCSGDCASYGYAWGNSVDNSFQHEEVKLEAFLFGGASRGSAIYGSSGHPVLVPRPSNTSGFPLELGNWLVRDAVTGVPGPASAWLFLAGLLVVFKSTGRSEPEVP